MVIVVGGIDEFGFFFKTTWLPLVFKVFVNSIMATFYPYLLLGEMLGTAEKTLPF